MSRNLFHHRVPCSDSFAKYAVAFFKMSRSILTRANSRLVSYSSRSNAVSSRCPLPTSQVSLIHMPLTQYLMVDDGNCNLRPTSGIDIFSSNDHPYCFFPKLPRKLPLGNPFYCHFDTSVSILILTHTLVSDFSIIPHWPACFNTLIQIFNTPQSLLWGDLKPSLEKGVWGIIMQLEWNWERDHMLSIKSDIIL